MFKIIILLLQCNLILFATEIDDFIDKHKCDQIIDKQIYTVCYSYKYKGAIAGWTLLEGKNVNTNNIKRRPRFYTNTKIPIAYRSKYSDYKKVSRIWNRGHFIISDADADYSLKSLQLAYDMCQIQPQAYNVNQHQWTKVEKYGRILATKFGKIYSISIADYRKTTKTLKNSIVIPKGFYRIYYNDKMNFKKCFYYKNNPFLDKKHDKLRNHLIDCKKNRLLIG